MDNKLIFSKKSIFIQCIFYSVWSIRNPQNSIINKLKYKIYVIDLLKEKDAIDQVFIYINKIRSSWFMENGFIRFTKRPWDTIYCYVYIIKKLKK